jgi:hypothetical protein
MHDFRAQVETLRNEACNCQLISDLALSVEKKELFAKLAAHHRVLASELQRTLNAGFPAAGGPRNHRRR